MNKKVTRQKAGEWNVTRNVEFPALPDRQAGFLPPGQDGVSRSDAPVAEMKVTIFFLLHILFSFLAQHSGCAVFHALSMQKAFRDPDKGNKEKPCQKNVLLLQ